MADAIIRIMCPNLRCRAILAVPAEARGRLVRCKACGSNIRIPQKAEEPAPGADDADQVDLTPDAAKQSRKKAGEAA